MLCLNCHIENERGEVCDRCAAELQYEPTPAEEKEVIRTMNFFHQLEEMRKEIEGR